MTDELPDLEGDFGVYHEARPVVVVRPDGVPASNGGAPIASNSTFTPLDADETFTGEWSTDNNDELGFSFEADQDGVLYLDISRNGGETFSTIKSYEITGGEVGRFDAIVKGAGRSFRLRYENGPTPQSTFELLAFTGNALFPFAVSDRNEPRFVAYAGNDIISTSYAILVDLSDKANFPHADTGSVDIHASYLFVDKPNNSVGAVQLGVITRIDGTDADISYVQGVSFNSASERQINRDRILATPIRLSQSGGELTKVATLFKEAGVRAVNTGSTLPTPLGTATPAVGDLVIKFDYTSGGAFNAAVSAQYAGNVKP